MVLQRYISQLILTYAQRYIKNIEASLNLSLWGGDMVFNNLEVRLDGQPHPPTPPIPPPQHPHYLYSPPLPAHPTPSSCLQCYNIP